jgi:prepilin-type processing-associated H-X9-DG protein/prepilin-type N-terminal cleavage/methylation domain-containing protein
MRNSLMDVIPEHSQNHIVNPVKSEFIMQRPASISFSARPRTGFTLVEILVVIVIIIILAAVLFGISRRGIQAARSANCVSNLRQIGASLISYAQERNGQLPPLEAKNPNGSGNGIWAVQLARAGYLWDPSTPGPPKLGEGVWACPECDFRNNNQRGYGVVEGTIFQYSDRPSTVNSRLGRQENGSLRLSQIEEPERTWLVGDVAQSPADLKKSWFAIFPQPSRWSGHTPAARHNRKVNVCMVDGHVETLTMRELKDPDKDFTMYKP